LANAIKVNELKTKKVDSSTVVGKDLLLGCAFDRNSYYAIRFVVEHISNDNAILEWTDYYKLYLAKARANVNSSNTVVGSQGKTLASSTFVAATNSESTAKESEKLTFSFPDTAATTIRISDLLDVVNNFYPDILSKDVLEHYGKTKESVGGLSSETLYTERDPYFVSNREALVNALDSVAVNDTEKTMLSEYKAKITIRQIPVRA